MSTHIVVKLKPAPVRRLVAAVVGRLLTQPVLDGVHVKGPIAEEALGAARDNQRDAQGTRVTRPPC
jgi:hypothetical protein